MIRYDILVTAVPGEIISILTILSSGLNWCLYQISALIWKFDGICTVISNFVWNFITFFSKASQYYKQWIDHFIYFGQR
jgi:hypothetical protein